MNFPLYQHPKEALSLLRELHRSVLLVAKWSKTPEPERSIAQSEVTFCKSLIDIVCDFRLVRKLKAASDDKASDVRD